MKHNPATFTPSTPKDLIGSAGQFAASLLKHVLELKNQPQSTLKLAFRGDPGTGKTTLVNMISSALASSKFDVETINGRNLTIDVVREWQKNACYGSMFGGWKIKIINEMDLIPATAQDLLLSYLDELPAKTAVLGSSNASASNLSDRFATRFQLVFVKAPEQISRASRPRQPGTGIPEAILENPATEKHQAETATAKTFMRIGTKSVLFGAHAFWLHPWFVALAWWKIYGFPFDPRLWFVFFLHDIGYWGKPNMDGHEGESHPELGAKIMWH